MRRVRDAVVITLALDLAAVLAWHAIVDGARLWLSWRQRPRGPIDPSLAARLAAEICK